MTDNYYSNMHLYRDNAYLFAGEAEKAKKSLKSSGLSETDARQKVIENYIEYKISQEGWLDQPVIFFDYVLNKFSGAPTEDNALLNKWDAGLLEPELRRAQNPAQLIDAHKDNINEIADMYGIKHEGNYESTKNKIIIKIEQRNNDNNYYADTLDKMCTCNDEKEFKRLAGSLSPCSDKKSDFVFKYMDNFGNDKQKIWLKQVMNQPVKGQQTSQLKQSIIANNYKELARLDEKYYGRFMGDCPVGELRTDLQSLGFLNVPVNDHEVRKIAVDLFQFAQYTSGMDDFVARLSAGDDKAFEELATNKLNAFLNNPNNEKYLRT